MSETTELIAQQIMNGNINKRTWGDILYNVKVYGAKGDGVKDDTALIDSAIDAASISGGIVFFPPGTYKTGSLMVPENVTLWFTNGAKLNINADATVTINGPIEAGLYQIFSTTGIVNGSMKNEKIYPQWWGAKGDGINDDTSAIQKALNTTLWVHLILGAYKVTSTLQFVGSGSKLTGVGDYSILALPGIPNGSVIVSSVPTGQPTLKVSDGLQHIEISNISIKRTTTSVGGNTGVYFEGNCNLCSVHDVEISGHFIGLWLGSTGFSTVDNVYSHDNYAYGVYMANSANSGALQWQLNNVLSQQNNLWGFFIQAVSNSVGFVTLGNMFRLNTFANTQGGIAFVGLPGTPINGIRIDNSFFGEDGGDEIYLDTYGSGSHKIQSTYTEAAGTGLTGVGQVTAASHTGHGIKVTSNVYSVTVSDCFAISHSYNGMELLSQQSVVTGCDVRLNGQAAAAGTRIGIHIGAGQSLIVGNKSMGQQFGVYLENDGYHMVTNNRLSQNTVQPVAAAVSIPNSVITPNITAG